MNNSVWVDLGYTEAEGEEIVKEMEAKGARLVPDEPASVTIDGELITQRMRITYER